MAKKPKGKPLHNDFNEDESGITALTTKDEPLPLPSEESIEPALQKARRRIDLSVLRKESPRLIHAIAMLLKAGASHNWIKDELKVDYETISVIAEENVPDIKEWRKSMARKMQMILSAASPALMQRAQKGDVTFLDAKFMSEITLSLAGESLGSYEVNVVHSVADDFKQAIRSVRAVETQSQQEVKSLSEGEDRNTFPDTEKDIEMLVTRVEHSV